jgi:hypothetical protein
MTDSQVSVGAALAYGWRLWAANGRTIWGVLAFNSLAWTVTFAGLISGNPSLVLGGFVGYLVGKYPLFGAVVRLGSAGEGPPPQESGLGALGFQWRRMELRMLAADVLMSIFVALMTLLATLAIGAPVLAIFLSQAGGAAKFATPEQVQQWINGPGARGADLVRYISNAAFIFVSTRLALSLVASGSSGRIAVLRTWRLTRGHFWSVLAASVLVMLPLLVTVAFAYGLSVTTGPGASPVALDPSGIFVYALVSGILAGALTMPLLAAVQLYFYRCLGPIDDSDSGLAGR